MRIAIGMGGVALVAGIAGMVVWIHDGSNYFGVAVALALAGFLTLVACVLTGVFGSSHGSQDDAFRRGRSMGYDAGFLEGHRTARPVVVPLHVVGGRDLEVPVTHLDRADPWGDPDADHVDEPDPPPAFLPVWRREAQNQVTGWDRALGWVVARRTPLLAGGLSLALLGVLAASAVARTPVPTQALPLVPGDLFHRAAPPSQALPALVPDTTHSLVSAAARVAGAGAGVALVPGAPGAPGAPSAAGAAGTNGDVGADGATAAGSAAGALSAGGAASAGGAVVQPGGGGAAAEPVVAQSGSLGGTSLPGGVVAAPAVAYQPPVDPPATTTTTAAQPVVVVPVVPLTAAQQTAADAEAAAALTAANAAAAADLTAANAAAAAARTAADAEAAASLTAANAAAAAAATAKAAEDAAWATAHPQT